MKRVVITGATGTIGLALIEECLKKNIAVLALVNPSSERIKKIPVADNVTVVECAMENYNSFEYPERYDAFFHLAWAGTDGYEARNQVYIHAKNIEYTLDAVELANRLGCTSFVGAGSQAEYGRHDVELNEDTATMPETAYGMAKLCSGEMSRLLCRRYGIKHVWTRILSTYGPNSNYKTVVNYTLNELLMGNSPKLSEGVQIWDFIYVNDAANALLSVADKGRDGEVYLIGSGKNNMLRDYLSIARDIVKETINHDVPCLNFGAVPYNENTVMHLTCSITKITRDTGFVPSVSFEEGIQRTIEWMINDKGIHK